MNRSGDTLSTIGLFHGLVGLVDFGLNSPQWDSPAHTILWVSVNSVQNFMYNHIVDKAPTSLGGHTFFLINFFSK